MHIYYYLLSYKKEGPNYKKQAVVALWMKLLGIINAVIIKDIECDEKR